jgi:hypothetical protein
VRSNSPAAVLGWNSDATRVGVVREEFGELPSGEAKLTWGLAGARKQRGGRSMVRQGARCGRASGRWCWGSGAAAVRR